MTEAVKAPAPLSSEAHEDSGRPLSAMGTLPMAWAEDQAQKRIPPGTTALRAKGKCRRCRKVGRPDADVDFTAPLGGGHSSSHVHSVM